MKPEAFFLASTRGEGDQGFCLFYPAQSHVVRGLVLYIHPFAEEMNKSRRMAALQARAFAQAGYAVLQIDLHGCGDSAGDFGDATWEHWIDDVVQGCHWLRQRCQADVYDLNSAPLWLWGLRAGCLLAVAAAKRLDESCHFLFWQAPASGKTILQQFLRLKVAGGLLQENTNGMMTEMRQRLASGDPLEIAGYKLSSDLARGLEQASLCAPVYPGVAQRLAWFEVSTQEDSGLRPASNQTLAAWRQAGFKTNSHLLYGPKFWQSNEIEEVPALIAASTSTISCTQTLPILEAA